MIASICSCSCSKQTPFRGFATLRYTDSRSTCYAFATLRYAATPNRKVVAARSVPPSGLQ